MNGAHLHLMLNHLPVVTTLLGVGLLAIACLWRRESLTRTAAGVLVAGALSALPAYFSGEQAEDTIEDRPGVSARAIEHHEEAAEAALLAVGALGVAALGVLVAFRTRPIPRTVAAAGVAVGLLAVALLGRTANLGGQISHPEIRADAAAAPAVGRD